MAQISAKLGVAIALGVVLAIVAAYVLTRSSGEEPGGFRDWVKNPAAKRAAAERFAARQSLTVPDNISDREIQGMVARLFRKEDDESNTDRLGLVGAKAVPHLIKALEDPKASTRFGEGGHVLAANSPFERICDLLEQSAPPEAVGPLARYVEHKDDYFRKHAAILLGAIGVEECVAPMLKLLADDDDYVRCYAMMGIQRGIASGRCTKPFLDAMFPALTKLLDRHDSSISGAAPDLLLAIDTDRALRVLMSPEYFTAANREVPSILKALNRAGHKVPRETLLPLLGTLKPLAHAYPHDDAYGEALKAYAANPDASAEETFRAALTMPNDRVKESAAEALGILVGISNAREIAFHAIDETGFARAPKPLQDFYAVLIYDSEVNNGGHAQYFVNSSGERWKAALDGLKAIGAPERAKILQEAVDLFGPTGPSEDNELRHEQLARFTKRQDKILDELNGRYYECNKNIDLLLSLYAIQNKAHFTGRK